MCPPSYLQSKAIPALQRGAEAAKRPVPKLLVHTPVCISRDLDAVRQAAREQVGLYTRLPSYAAMFAEAGHEVSDGLSDRLIDELVMSGDEATVAEGLQRLRERGADEVIAHPLLTADRDFSLRAAWRSVAMANGEVPGTQIPDARQT
jgi:alkanesulfonate monooxygenase SsuD/methylene tetrahydromethanopterin reductase-like flavin-dependent oxidoreductase (luciferase family)